MRAHVSRFRNGRAAAPSAALLIALLGSGAAWAHGGGLNAEGCHTNRKTGDYHCHRPAAASAPRRQNVAPATFAPARAAPSGQAPAGRAFANCTEARAAGAAPVYRGDPGYGPHLDRDNDGIGCEPYRGR
ncbi:excalibur calcium-binding domain-containing protein [Luteimonas kalidii]|uniref:Excalibur calcium-binding domain-containing protein n=1 Tax=Luteimonas kalidii TaxID=3042025 RepID=A0ABT6JQR2_9GAMM|nr:excalibur calcium-binding domain-containing protein [Luteimonas kalidii]MDH5832845.1 excalibur calcium-binding domain-containing protein [Luteimonas kalidii]